MMIVFHNGPKSTYVQAENIIIYFSQFTRQKHLLIIIIIKRDQERKKKKKALFEEA